MIYFLQAPSIPVIKVGHSADPNKRLSNMRTFSPVPLEIMAVDKKGDALTEVEFMYRFRAYRSHGEWFFAIPEIQKIVAATAQTGSLPDAWYVLAGYPGPKHFSSTQCGPTLEQMKAAFGLVQKDLRKALGLTVVQDFWLGSPIRYTPPLVHYLRAHGFPELTHLDFFRECEKHPRERIKLAA